ncbi:MAG: oxidoreductase [Deltaproteobacteria bacterium]|jgi:F420-non-reducing hydrogenase small subunit|nr:oxidoreductase [Deltaproteobacteria bacterium]MBW2530239.1 oxidoreductase [Deltaproteobacteria bacterium]
MSKPKVAFYWCASCGGCEEAVVDLGPDLLAVAEAVDIVFWPAAMDFKTSDVRALGSGEIAVTFLNGAIRTTEQAEMAALLRDRSQLMIAFGSCAHLGGIPGLGNLVDNERVFRAAYDDAPTVVNPEGIRPSALAQVGPYDLALPALTDAVCALDQVVDVDYYLPGCAPPPDLVLGAVRAVLDGQLPDKGAVLCPDKILCDTCPRNESKPDELSLSEIVRVHEVEVAPDRCFLDAGVLCVGIGTRSGCGERCIRAHMPCTGCFGPTSKVPDQGAKLLSAVASLLDAEDADRAAELAAAVPDPAGTFYRYSLPRSLLKGRI